MALKSGAISAGLLHLLDGEKDSAGRPVEVDVSRNGRVCRVKREACGEVLRSMYSISSDMATSGWP